MLICHKYSYYVVSEISIGFYIQIAKSFNKLIKYNLTQLF